jgi:hypothetical protein
MPAATPLTAEILELLASHAGQPVDFVALFMFLNTVAGGNYEERYTEADLGQGLRTLLEGQAIVAWDKDHPLSPQAAPISSQSRIQFRLPQV